MPLRLPCTQLDGAQLDEALHDGDRRCGRLLYRPECPTCRSCQAIRIPVQEFSPSRAQRRAWQRGNRELTCRIVSPVVDHQRVQLFNRHSLQRGLGSEPINDEQYARFLVETCCPTLELDFYCGQQLVAVAIADRGHHALSAVYCFYDPQLSGLSLGTYAILRQIEFCRQWRLSFMYLGLFVAANRHMSYKDRFRPHEKLVAGVWHRSAR